MKAFYCCLFYLCSYTVCPAQSGIKNPYPFSLQHNSGTFGIVADVQDPSLYPKYYDLFKKHGYEGNGYCWAGLIEQILEKQAPDLLKKIVFDPEAGAFYAKAENDAARQQFIQIISPVFSNLKTLEDHIKSADRSRIDD
jgi:hypothetical protein